MESKVRKTMCSKREVFLYGTGNSFELLCIDDVIDVSLLKGVEAIDGTSEKDLQLR